MDNKNYILKCGNFTYEVTFDVQKILEAAMYWMHCQRLDSMELQAAEKDRKERGENSRWTESDIAVLRHDVKECELRLRDIMTDMEKHNVPNWVGNAALYFGEDNDLRKHYMMEFFINSPYAVEENKLRLH